MQLMKSLDKLSRPIVRPMLEQYGFAHGDLVAQWSAIVGDDIAARCSPGKLSWPRGRDAGNRQAEGATLAVRADRGAGLALSYETTSIIERINAFFGYQAVSGIKVVQGDRPVRKTSSHPEPVIPSAQTVTAVSAKTSGISDESLRMALDRLGQRALTRSNL